MRNQLLTPLLFLAIFSACQGQNKPDLPKEDKPQASLSALNPLEKDPYFIGNHDTVRVHFKLSHDMTK